MGKGCYGRRFGLGVCGRKGSGGLAGILDRFPRGFYKFPWVLEGFRVLEWFRVSRFRLPHPHRQARFMDSDPSVGSMLSHSDSPAEISRLFKNWDLGIWGCML